MASPRPTTQKRGFALIFAAVITAALALTVASVSTTSGLMQQQAATRKWAILARSLAEQGLSRGLADVTAVARVSGDMDLDRALDPSVKTGSQDTGACPDTGCSGQDTSSDDYLPSSGAITGAGSAQYGNWGAGTTTFQNQTYRRVSTGNGAYLVRFDDNQDDSSALVLPSTTTNNVVVEGANVDVPNRDRDMQIVVTSVGLAGGTTEAGAKARYVARAVVRTTGGKAVRAGSYADVDDSVCGAGLQVCKTTQVPNCWCGELEYDSTASAPSLPGSYPCPNCAGNCPPQSARSVANLCPLLQPGPIKPLDYVTEIDKRATYGTLISATGYAKGRALFRVDHNQNVTLRNTGPDVEPNAFIIHMWDSNAAAGCSSTTGNLPNPDFNFESWSIPADCWVPVYMETAAGNMDTACLYDYNSTAAYSGWLQPDCRATTPLLNSGSFDPGVGFGDRCSNAATCAVPCGTPGWCPGKNFGGTVNALDSAVSSTTDGTFGHSGGPGGIHAFGAAYNHRRIVGGRKANTAGLGATAQITNPYNGNTNVTWAAFAGCAGCTDTNTLGLDLNQSTGGTVSVHKDGPQGIFLNYTGDGNITLTVNGGPTAAAPSQTGFVFRGLANVTTTAGMFIESTTSAYALYNRSNCTLNANIFAKPGIWCSGNITSPGVNNVYYMGDLTAGDDDLVGNIEIGKNNNQFCSSQLTSCPASPAACSGARATYWATGNITVGDNGGGTGPDICADLKANFNITVPSNSSNSHLSGTVWAGGNLNTGNNTEVSPQGVTMLGASPSVLSVQGFAY